MQLPEGILNILDNVQVRDLQEKVSDYKQFQEDYLVKQFKGVTLKDPNNLEEETSTKVRTVKQIGQ